MWGNWKNISSAVALGVTVCLVSYEPAWAKRAKDYTPSEFRAVLNGLGYNVSLGETLTDDATKQAIRDFQKQYGLSVDGVAGDQTQNTAADVISNLQASLNIVVKPNPLLPRSQYYGPETTTAIKAFQQKYNLPITGIASFSVRQQLDIEAKKLIAKPPTNKPTPQPQPQAKPQPQPTSQKPPQPVVSKYNVAQFLTVLNGLGYKVNLNGNSLDDALTQQAIREFQREYKLQVDGIAGPQTVETAAKVVRNVQNNLNIVLKFNPERTATGFYDADTEQAVKQFQSLAKLPVTGIASLGVRKELDAQARKLIGR